MHWMGTRLDAAGFMFISFHDVGGIPKRFCPNHRVDHEDILPLEGLLPESCFHLALTMVIA